MKHPTRIAARLLTASVLVVPCAAAPQTTVVPPGEAQGLFSNLPVGLTIPGAAEPLLIRAAGTAAGVPIEWSQAAFSSATADHPDYSWSALTSHWKPSGASAPEFGGISTGGEVMPAVDVHGQMIMAQRWHMLAVSVDAAARGAPGSMLEILSANGRNPAGDVFSYYAVGSVGIHPELVDTVRIEQSREQLQLQEVAIVPADDDREIANFDFGLGVISIDPENRAGILFPVRRSFYFTLSQAWLANVPGFQLAGGTANASTVYAMQWSTLPNPGWSSPSIAFSHQELFGEISPGSIEIDALSVDQGQGGWASPDRVVFSLTPASDDHGPFDQILVHQRPNGNLVACPTTTLRTEPNHGTSSGPVRERLGLWARTFDGEPDNVTATCGGDPLEPYQVGPVVGIATDQNASRDGALGLAAFRSCPPHHGATSDADLDTLHIRVAGTLHDPYEFGLVVFYIEGAVQPPNEVPKEPQQWGGAHWIDADVALQNSLDLPVQIPHDLDGTLLRFSARCFGVKLSPFVVVELRESWVISIRI